MFFRKTVFVFAVLSFLIPKTQAQEDTQFRLLLHSTVDVTDAWYIPSWVIATTATASPDNVNLLIGMGYREKGWWLEGMIQRHWNTKTKQWFINFRFRKEFGEEGPDRGRMVFYLEPTVVLSQRGFAESAFWEYRVFDSSSSKRRPSFSVGAETENIQRRNNKDTWGAGPRASYAIGPQTTRVIIAVTYQVRLRERDMWRVYLVLNQRFK